TGLQNQLGSEWTLVGSIPTRSRHALSTFVSHGCDTAAPNLPQSRSLSQRPSTASRGTTLAMKTGRLAGSEPCPRLRSVMRNGDRIVGSRPLPAAPPNLRLYPSTSRTFCASARAPARAFDAGRWPLRGSLTSRRLEERPGPETLATGHGAVAKTHASRYLGRVSNPWSSRACGLFSSSSRRRAATAPGSNRCPARPSPTTPLCLPIGLHLLAASKETPAITVPRLLFGLPLARGQRLIAGAMLANTSDVAYRRVHVRLVLHYVPGGLPWPLYRTYPWAIDVQY